MSAILEWEKDCDCKTEHTKPVVYGFEFKQILLNDDTRYRMEFIEKTPFCDACGKPWKKVKANAM